MKQISRRKFIRLVGGGAAAAGLGGMSLPGRLLAMAGSARKTEDDQWGEWEFYYPNQYNDEDAEILKAFFAGVDAVDDKGTIDIGDLLSGKLSGIPGIGRATTITREAMDTIAKANVGTNPLFTDPKYARKTKYGDLIAFPMISCLEVMPAMVKAKGIADYMVVTSHNDATNYYKPFYEGDTLYEVVDYQRCVDITPEEGSYYRTFVMSGRVRVFNQKGELVSEGANVLKESFRRHKEKARRNVDGAHAWESPDWWTRPKYRYTDKDWEKIVAMWKSETVRGADTRYWDDVKVGDTLPPRAVGPLILNETADMAMTIPQYAMDIRENVLDPETFARMKKNEYGIWVLPEYLEKKPKTEAGGPGSGQGAPDGPDSTGTMDRVGGQKAVSRGWSPSEPEVRAVTPQRANRDGRAVFQNSVVAKLTAGTILNWIGDDGWLQRIGWDIMDVPPGSDATIDFQANPTKIPNIPEALYPDLFDKFPYLEKVPFMKGKRANYHVLENDLIICNAYVTDKYQKDGEYFLDLVWWNTTLDGYLVQEGFATVKLPKRA